MSILAASVILMTSCILVAFLGSRQERFAPYSANSGFYFVRSNDRTKLLFRSMLYNGDLVFACRSHQQVLVSMLAEMNNYAGLTVKVLNR